MKFLMIAVAKIALMGDVVKTEQTQYTVRENSQTGNNQQQQGEKQDSNRKAQIHRKLDII